MGRIFANPMDELVEFQELKKDLTGGRGPVLLSGCIDSQKAHLISELSGLTPWKLVITYDEQKAREICDDCRCFCPETFLYPSRDLLFYSSDIQGNLLTRQRMQVIRRIFEGAGGVIVAYI